MLVWEAQAYAQGASDDDAPVTDELSESRDEPRTEPPADLPFDLEGADLSAPPSEDHAPIVAGPARVEEPEADSRRVRFTGFPFVFYLPETSVGFGFGKHFCLGASLARLEARVALEALVPALLRARRAETHIPRIDSFLVRGPSRLPLSEAA